MALASCTNYKAALNLQTGRDSADTVLPRSAEAQREIIVTEEKVTGEVRLRFDVSETGGVSGVEILEASDERLEEKALDLIESWPMEPGTIAGRPASFEDLEYTMVFFTDDSTTTGEVVGKGLLVTAAVVVLVPLYVLASLAAHH